MRELKNGCRVDFLLGVFLSKLSILMAMVMNAENVKSSPLQANSA